MNLKDPLWQQLIIQIYKRRPKQRYLSRIHRNLKGSLTHLRVILQRLQERGLILINRKQNRKMLELTQKGEKVAIALLTLKSEINNHTLHHA